jgi:HIP---CoA ligase
VIAHETIVGVLHLGAERHPDREAIVDRTTRLTYAGLVVEVRATAAVMLAHGVSAGSRVAIWAPNSPRWIIVALAAQTCGAAIVPLNTRLTVGEVEHALRITSAGTIFTTQHFLDEDRVESAATLLPRLTELERVVAIDDNSGPTGWTAYHARAASSADVLAAEQALDPSQICDVMFTSGTTGLPKGAMFTHQQTVMTYSTFASLIEIVPSDRYLIIPPFSHSFGYKAGWLTAFLVGATVLPVPVFEPDETLRLVDDEAVSILTGPPTLFGSLQASPEWTGSDHSSFRLTITGATIVPPSLVHSLRHEFGFETIIIAYGMTECSALATSCTPADSLEDIAGSSGRPIPGVEVVIVDDEGNRVAAGDVGEVLVRGYNVMQGYVGSTSPEGVIDSEGWLHTGDIGRVSSANRLTITDRKKDMYISNGFNVYPAEVEQQIATHPAVAEVAVVGVPDERQGEAGMAFVVCQPGDSFGLDELQQWCKSTVASYKMPRHLRLVESLARNASGKVLKGVLRELAAQERDDA